jgi:alkaline phosphatase
LLDEDGKPFLLMVEGSQIDWGGHANDYTYIVQEMLDMDKAVGVALNYAEQRPATLVLVTADHETGGLSLAAIDSYYDMSPRFSTTKHTAAMVPILSAGWQADKFGGIIHNTTIHERLVQLIEEY